MSLKFFEMTKNIPKRLKIRYCQFLLNVVSKGNLVLGDKSVANCLTIKVFLLTHVQMFLIAPFFLFLGKPSQLTQHLFDDYRKVI